MDTSVLFQRARSWVCASLLLATPAAMASDQRDPWEGFNRSVFSFNEGLDRYVAKPVARAYQTVMPQVLDDMVSRFFNNLFAPITITNALLQGKGHVAAEQTSRFMFNTTAGLAGFFDVATPMGLPRVKEDFGQTLAVWGVPSGPYVMLPVLGPSTIRDFSGRLVDVIPDPRRMVNSPAKYFVTALDLTDTRADLLAAEKGIEGDRYLFIRDYYLQQRAFAITDGKVARDDFLDDSLDMDSDMSEPAKP